MSEFEKLELEKAKLMIKYFGWSAEDLGFEVSSGGMGGYEKLNDGNIFTSIMANSRAFKGHYLGIVDGDTKLEDHNFQTRSTPRAYISTNSPIEVGDKFELFKIK